MNAEESILTEFENNLQVIHEHMRVQGFQSPAEKHTAVAKAGAEAYETFIKEHPDLVLKAQSILSEWMVRVIGH